MEPCVFCEIASGATEASIVYEDRDCLALLDHAPLFPGHCLLIPRLHYPTLMDLPPELLAPLFSAAQTVARGVEAALGADGIFVGLNNRVSQSVPHVHIHIVPRRRGDGLQGFFWPRRRYRDASEKTALAERLRAALEL